MKPVIMNYFIKNKIFMPFMVMTKYANTLGFEYPELYNKVIDVATNDVKFGMSFMVTIFNKYRDHGENYPLPLNISKNLINEKNPHKYIEYLYSIFRRDYFEHYLSNIAYKTLLKHLIKILPSITETEKEYEYSIDVRHGLEFILKSILYYKMEPKNLFNSVLNSIPDKYKKNISFNKETNLNDSYVYDLMKSFLLKS